MSNELSKAIKRKTDAQFRTMGEDRTPSVSEGADGSVVIVDPSVYTIPYVAGKNIFIGTSGSNKVINAIMNLAPGANISVSEPDPTTGQVTISATIGGKEIDLTGLADGHVLTYDQTNDKFIFAEPPNWMVQATETALGGIKAKARTEETLEVVIDPLTAKLYSPGSIYELPQATDEILGGVKPKLRSSESSEVAIDPATGKLYSAAPTEAQNGMPAGGTAGQILSKLDATDYNTKWMDDRRAIAYYIGGVLETSEQIMTVIAPIKLAIVEVRAHVDEAPVGSSLVCDLKINGVSIYTNGVDRPTILENEYDSTNGLHDDVLIQIGDRVSLDIVSIGSTSPGSNLSLSVICEAR